jgi:branched-chain amino acid transport system substrate-binding protein
MKRSIFSKRRRFLTTVAAGMAAMSTTKFALAADPLKIGLILPLTGPFASTGKQIEAACRLYIARNGDTVAGRKVELIVRRIPAWRPKPPNASLRSSSCRTA